MDIYFPIYFWKDEHGWWWGDPDRGEGRAVGPSLTFETCLSNFYRCWA